MLEDYQDNYGGGWISVYRSIKDHWVWSDPVKLKWWLIILFEVNHTVSKISLGYDIYEIRAGQSAKSLRTWASLFDVGTKSVVRFFEMLEKDGMIKREILGKGKQSTTLLIVLNYGVYQKQNPKKGNAKGYAKETQGGTQGKRKRHTNNKDNKDNKENNSSVDKSSLLFDDSSFDNQNIVSSKRKYSEVPTKQEVVDYFKEKGFSEEFALMAFKHYNEPMLEIGGRVWKDKRGNTVKNWKRKITDNWLTEKNKLVHGEARKEQQERIKRACNWVVTNLNNVLDTKYTADAEPTKEAVKKLILKGYGVDDFKTVFKKKVNEWKGTEFEINLQPHILFGKNFEAYLEQPERKREDSSETNIVVKMNTEEYSR